MYDCGARPFCRPVTGVGQGLGYTVYRGHVLDIRYFYAEIWVFGISFVCLQLIMDIKCTPSLSILGILGGGGHFGCIGTPPGRPRVIWSSFSKQKSFTTRANALDEMLS